MGDWQLLYLDFFFSLKFCHAENHWQCWWKSRVDGIKTQMNWEQETRLIIIPQKQILHLCACRHINGIFSLHCDPNLLFYSFQESEVQVVLVAIKETFVVGEDKVSGIVAPPDAFQLNVVLVPTFSMGAKPHAQILMPWPESTATGIQTVMNLRMKQVGSVCISNSVHLCEYMLQLGLDKCASLAIWSLSTAVLPSGNPAPSVVIFLLFENLWLSYQDGIHCRSWWWGSACQAGF